MAVPNIFGTATAAIPLSQLDSNFATTITLGNTAVQLGNTVTTLNNMTLANVTVSSGNVTLTNVAVTTANVTTANIVTAVITTANVTTANVSTALSYSGTLTGGTGIVNLGSGQFYKDASGLVGIGTASPTVKLQVTTAAAAALPASSGTTLSAGTLIRLGTSSDSAGGIGTIGLATNQMWIQVTDSTNLATGNQLLLNPNGGNVGIGTSSPSQKLDVFGAAQISFSGANTYLYFESTLNYAGRATDGNFWLNVAAGQNILFGVGAAEKMRIDSSGNVGIGTSSPVDLLQINRASGSGITSGISLTTAAGTVGDGSYIKWTGATAGEKIARIDGVQEGTDIGSIRFNTGNGADGFAERMRIDSSGNVGIGMSPTNFGNGYTVLQVANATNGGMLYLTNTSSVGGRIYGNTSGINYDTLSAASHLFNNDVAVFSTNPSSSQQGVLLRNVFNVGPSIFSMGSATSNGIINFVGGAGTQGAINGNGSGINFVTTSDYRLKENVAPMTGALAKVAQLKPCTYTWKFDGSDGQGFIAHELQEVFPTAVSGEKDDVETYTDEDGNEQTRIKPQGVDTSNLVATLTAAIQEQQALITSLAARIAALEST